MTLIKTLHAREILDSRGNPTLEAEIVLDSGAQEMQRTNSERAVWDHERTRSHHPDSA